jgi:flagellar P-ring protein precursor FlgI
MSKGGRTVTSRTANVEAQEGSGRAVALPATTTVEDLVKALNMVGVGPRDLVAVLQAMKAAGAIDADLEVM